METGDCDSCGEVGCVDLLALHRLYVTPEAWDTEGSVTEVDEVERWCSACRAVYPHLPVGAELPGAPEPADAADAADAEG